MTTVAGVIPAAEHGVGFVAAAVRFPADPVVHRIVRIYHRADGTTGGMPARFDGTDKTTTEVRPACRPDSDPAARHYELSVPTALHRDGIPCGHSECFGGTA